MAMRCVLNHSCSPSGFLSPVQGLRHGMSLTDAACGVCLGCPSMHLFGSPRVNGVRPDRLLHLPCCLCLPPFGGDLRLALAWIYIPLAVYAGFLEYLSDCGNDIRIVFCHVFFAVYIPGDVIQLYRPGRMIASVFGAAAPASSAAVARKSYNAQIWSLS